jgi:predicted SprT family Zn-dependent metalloprotease
MNKIEMMRKHHKSVMMEARRLYGDLPPCEVRFSTRGTRQLGNHHYDLRTKKHRITYQIRALENYDDCINLQTVPHEIAHFVCEAKGLGKCHDKGWKKVCLELGGDGKTYAPQPKTQPIKKQPIKKKPIKKKPTRNMSEIVRILKIILKKSSKKP